MNVELLEAVLALLGGALVLSALAARASLPPAAALVVGGMMLGLVPNAPSLELDPDLVLVLFLPPLLLSSAYFTVWRDFVANLRPILLLSLGAVAFTTAAVGVAAHWIMPGLPWAACFALGAIVSPPDAVAAKAVLDGLTLPRRVVTILEGESLVNDASGLVLYRFAVVAALTGTFGPAEAAASFVWLAVGGTGIGLAIGWGMTLLFRRMTDSHLTIVSSFLATYGAYIAAERLGASGVLSVVACGLLMGTRQYDLLDASTRMQAAAVWSVVVFVMEALVFVLIGLSLRDVLERMGGDLAGLRAGLPLAAGVVATVVVSRTVWVFMASFLPHWLTPPRRRRTDAPRPSPLLIVSWAGMRGVVSLALALGLPAHFPQRDLVLFASFAVILVTVLVQGVTLGPLIRWLDLKDDADTGELGLRAARSRAAQASLRKLESLVAEDGTPLHPKLMEEYARRLRAAARFQKDGDVVAPERDLHFAAALQAVEAGRAELIDLNRQGKLHASILRMLEAELDLEELRLTKLRG